MSPKNKRHNDSKGSNGDSSDNGKKMLDSAFEYVIVPLAILDPKFNFVRVNN